jgi:hypothetical protein
LAGAHYAVRAEIPVLKFPAEDLRSDPRIQDLLRRMNFPK